MPVRWCWVSLYEHHLPQACSAAAGLCWWAALWLVSSASWSVSLCCVCRGDYLAIVTLAFGEIIKNFMNACNLGVDSKGLHFSLKDTASLNLDADGKVLINGAMGITGIKKASTFTIGIVLVIITLAVILNLVNSRAGRAITSIRDNRDRRSFGRYPHHQVQADGFCDLRCVCRYGRCALLAELLLSGR